MVRYEFPLGDFAGVFGELAQLKSEGTEVPVDDDGISEVVWRAPTWREMLGEALSKNDETVADIVCGHWDHGGQEDEAPDYGDKGFTIWTSNNIYFPVVYDGEFSVASVPRHPRAKATEPVGGGG